MKAPVQEVEALLQHEDQEIRETAYEFVGYCEDISTILADLKKSTRNFPDPVVALMEKQLMARDGLLAEVQGATYVPANTF
jgi:hypothetical protein